MRVAVVPLAFPLAADETPKPQDGIRSKDSTADLKRLDEDLERRLRRLSRRGFALGGVAALAGVGGWQWLVTRSDEGGLPWPLRRVLEFDERLARGLFRPSRLSPQFPRSAARMPRVNGSIGVASTPRPGQVEAPGHRAGRRAFAAVVHPRRDQGPSEDRDDDRAAMHRGLE